MEGDQLLPASTVPTAQVGAVDTPSSRGPTDAKAMDAPSNSQPPAIIGGIREALQNRDKEAIPEQHVSRYDTFDSFRSFNHPNRTDTGFSTNASIATEFTEPDRDLATLNDDEDLYASSPRPLSRWATFQSQPPSRVSSFALADDNFRSSRIAGSPEDVPTPKHSGIRRVQEMSSPPRRNTSGRPAAAGPSHPGAVPIPRRGSSSSFNPPSAPIAQDMHRLQPSSLGRGDRPFGSRSPSPTGAAEPPRTMTCELRLKTEHEAPRGQQPHGIVTPILEETEPPSACDDEMPEELYSSQMSDFSDIACDEGLRSQRPDPQVIHDACDKLLNNVFGVELQDLAATDAASAAYNSVSYCLEELARIVPEGNLAAFGPPVCELPRRVGPPSHTPIRPAENGGDQNGGNDGDGNGGRPPKRPHSDNNQGQGGASSGDGNGGGGGGKKPKTEPGQPSQQEDQNLSCPFRKRNPVKFNVRDYQSCAVQSFPDISLLKRHVKLFHRQKTISGAFPCPRCKKDIGSQEGLQYHLAVPNDRVCSFQETMSSQDPEDGISAKVEDALNGRRLNTKVDTWHILWRTLFPLPNGEEIDEHDIPDPEFVPPVELDEVLAEFQTEKCDQLLRSRIELQERSLAGSGQTSCERVESWLKLYKEFNVQIFEDCRQQKTGKSCGHPRRKRSQKGKGKAAAVEQTLPLLGTSPSSSSVNSGSWNVVAGAGQITPQSGPMRNRSDASLMPPVPANMFQGLLNAGMGDVDLLTAGNAANQGSPTQLPVNSRHEKWYGGDATSLPTHSRDMSTDSGISGIPSGMNADMGFNRVPVYSPAYDPFQAQPAFTAQGPYVGYGQHPNMSLPDSHSDVSTGYSQMSTSTMGPSTLNTPLDPSMDSSLDSGLDSAYDDFSYPPQSGLGWREP